MRDDTFPPELQAVLDSDTRAAWCQIRPYLPNGTYLAGGTAVAVHLNHRESHDLDFFTSEPFDPEALLDELYESQLVFVTDQVGQRRGVLQIHLGATKVEFGDASRTPLVEETTVVVGVPVAGLGDLLAMKLAAITKRKELRDFEDLRAIEVEGGRRTEEGLAIYATRYGVRDDASFVAVLDAIAEVARCGDDPLVHTPRQDLESYWASRLPELIAALSRWDVAKASPEVVGAALREGSPDIDDVVMVPATSSGGSRASAGRTGEPKKGSLISPAPTTPMCRARTRSGAACPWHALPGKQFCGVHLRG
jgi:hypothetical protein